MNQGKAFEKDIADSCKAQGIFFYRIKDVYIPHDLKKRVHVTPNKYDGFVFHQGLLIPLELKSTASKSFAFAESIIKQHQVDNLLEASHYDGVLPGFLFNYRSCDNQTFFVPIQKFVEYKDIAQGKSDAPSPYKTKINKSSLPMNIAQEIGIEVECEKKRTRYRYDIRKLIEVIACPKN